VTGAIRLAALPDTRHVVACVDAAFAPYAPLIGRPPAPMLAAWPALIGQGVVQVLEDEGVIAGVLVVEPRADHLVVETLAVDPLRQRRGVGRRLMAFAEAEARRQGLGRIALYTHEIMGEARAFYRALGYREVGRHEEAGYARVCLEKAVLPGRGGNGGQGLGGGGPRP